MKTIMLLDRRRSVRQGFRLALSMTLLVSVLALIFPRQLAITKETSSRLHDKADALELTSLIRPDSALHELPSSLEGAMLEAPETDPFLVVVDRTMQIPATQVVQPAPLSEPTQVAPVISYRFLGQITDPQGVRKVYLARPDKEVLVEVGARLDEGYLIEAIKEDEVCLYYEPLQQRVSIRIPPQPVNPF